MNTIVYVTITYLETSTSKFEVNSDLSCGDDKKVLAAISLSGGESLKLDKSIRSRTAYA